MNESTIVVSTECHATEPVSYLLFKQHMLLVIQCVCWPCNSVIQLILHVDVQVTHVEVPHTNILLFQIHELACFGFQIRFFCLQSQVNRLQTKDPDIRLLCMLCCSAVCMLCCMYALLYVCQTSCTSRWSLLSLSPTLAYTRK